MGKQYTQCKTCHEVDDVDNCACCKQRVAARERSYSWAKRNPEKYEAKKRRDIARVQQKLGIIPKSQQSQSSRPERTEYSAADLMHLSIEHFERAITECRIVGSLGVINKGELR